MNTKIVFMALVSLVMAAAISLPQSCVKKTEYRFDAQALADSIRKVKEGYDAQIAGLTGQLTAANNQKAALEAEKAQLQSQLAAAMTPEEKAELNARITAKDAEIATKTQTIAALNAEIEELQAQIADNPALAEEERAELLAQINALTPDVVIAEAHTADSIAKIVQLAAAATTQNPVRVTNNALTLTLGGQGDVASYKQFLAAVAAGKVKLLGGAAKFGAIVNATPATTIALARVDYDAWGRPTIAGEGFKLSRVNPKNVNTTFNVASDTLDVYKVGEILNKFKETGMLWVADDVPANAQGIKKVIAKLETLRKKFPDGIPVLGGDDTHMLSQGNLSYEMEDAQTLYPVLMAMRANELRYVDGGLVVDTLNGFKVVHEDQPMLGSGEQFIKTSDVLAGGMKSATPVEGKIPVMGETSSTYPAVVDIPPQQVLGENTTITLEELFAFVNYLDSKLKIVNGTNFVLNYRNLGQKYDLKWCPFGEDVTTQETATSDYFKELYLNSKNILNSRLGNVFQNCP